MVVNYWATNTSSCAIHTCNRDNLADHECVLEFLRTGGGSNCTTQNGGIFWDLSGVGIFPGGIHAPSRKFYLFSLNCNGHANLSLSEKKR